MTNNNFPIIDPHHHLWDLEHYRYPWLQDGVAPIVFGDYEPIRKSYLIENFLDDARNQNVVKSVHVDVGYDRTDPAGETRWLQSVADQHGFPHGIVGYADLGRPMFSRFWKRTPSFVTSGGYGIPSTITAILLKHISTAPT